MKKILNLFFLSFLLVSVGFAQQSQIPLNSEEKTISILEDNYQKLELTFNHAFINSFTVETEKGLFNEITIPGTQFVGKVGTPKLPVYSKLIEVPYGAELELKVIDYNVEEFVLADYGINHFVMPYQPDVEKNEDPTAVRFYFNEEEYRSRGVFSYKLADVGIVGQMRGVTIANLVVSPIEYDPMGGKIKVYNNIQVEVSYKNANVRKTESIKEKTYSPYFEPVYAKLLNHKSFTDDHPDLTKYPVKMLILADRQFEEALEPYILWKTQKGFEVIVNYTDEGYNTVATIKSWVQGHYDAGTPQSPAPSFCLFVGDVAQIPASQIGVESGKMTDLYYFSQDGDYFPEMYYGRFSANNITELQPQIDKTLYYEKYEFEDPTFLDDVTLIAGADGNWNPKVGQAAIKYGSQNYFNAAHGFSTVNQYLTEYDGCYDPERISVSFINYTAHCSEGSWGDPSLTIADISNFSNEGKYPLAVGNCCLSAEFGTTTCVGEAWVRAENKGAVAYIGSSPSSLWFEDFYWAVGAFPIQGTNDGYVPTVDETTMGVYDGMFTGDYKAVDASIFLGNLAVCEVEANDYPSHSNPTYYWEAYNCLGDPSLLIYHTQGSNNIVSHLPTFPIGVASFEVSAEPGSYVGISKDGVLLGAGLIDATGTSNIAVTPVTSGGKVMIVVTKPEYKPYMVELDAAALDGPFLVIDNCAKTIDYGQTKSLDVVLKNVGSDATSNVVVSATTADASASITEAENVSFGDIDADGSAGPIANSFKLTVDNNLENGHKVKVDFSITNGDTTWLSSKYIIVNAPEISIGELAVVNEPNGNGIIEPEETGDIGFVVKNTGAASAVYSLSIAEIDDVDEYLSLGLTNIEDVTIEAGGSHNFVFTGVTAAAGVPLGTFMKLKLSATAGEEAQYVAVDTQEMVIGIIPVYPIADEGTLTVCTGEFYDSGTESNDYGNNEDYTMSFLPPEGEDFVVIEFVEFETEKNYDKLLVYSGPDVDGELIGEFSGKELPGTFVSATGLTFNFQSDYGGTRKGWKAKVSCATPTAPPGCVTNPLPADGARNVFPTKLVWDRVMFATSYDVYFGTNEDPYTNTPVNVTTNEIALSTEPNTTYYWAVAPINNFGTNDDCEEFSFETGSEVVLMGDADTITTCDAVFYDTGGTEAGYGPNENITMKVFPETEGRMVRAKFVSFATEKNYDKLKIYDGSDVATADLIGEFTGEDATASPGIITATNDEGALTFVFTSDGVFHKDGWEAVLSCVYANGYDVTFNVTDGENPLSRATVDFGGEIYSTDDKGQVEINLESAMLGVEYTVSKEGYKIVTGTVDVDENKILDIVLGGLDAISNAGNNIVISPNPSNGLFKINVSNLNAEEVEVEIYSIAGEKVYSGKTTDNVVDIDISNVAAGIYGLRIKTADNVYIKKLIVQ